MTAYVLDTTIVATSLIYGSTATNDSVTFLQGLTFFNTIGNAVDIVHGNNTVYNMGTIMSGAATGVLVDFANDCVVVNSASGTIASLDPSGSWQAVSLAGLRNVLRNMGEISSNTGMGVYLLGSDSIIDNSGTIAGGSYGVFASGSFSIANSGTIVSAGGSGSVAIRLDGNGTGSGSSLVNSGLIQSLAVVGGTAVQVDGNTLTTILNSGTIQSFGYAAVDAFSSSGPLHLNNSGTITGSVIASYVVFGTSQNDVIINSGTINGSVSLGSGDDLFDGVGGTVVGSVNGGQGNDTFRLSDPLTNVFESAGGGTADRVEAAVSYSLVAAGEVENLTLLGNAVVGTGNALANVMIGSQGDNSLFGLAGNDVIYGGMGAGDDRLAGGAGNDSLTGRDGSDVLTGNIGNDRLDGNDDDDVLNGGLGNDTLFGGANEDRLIGGAGRDLLYGGAERDTFVFLNRADSGTTGTTRDTIQDYRLGVDVINLSGVDANINLAGNQAFAFVPGGVFTNVAGQLIFQVSGPNGLLSADLDGNGTVDFSIQLTGATTFSVNDLVL